MCRHAAALHPPEACKLAAPGRVLYEIRLTPQSVLGDLDEDGGGQAPDVEPPLWRLVVEVVHAVLVFLLAKSGDAGAPNQDICLGL